MDAITEKTDFELSHFLLLSPIALKWFPSDHIMRGCRLMFARRETATDLKFAHLPTRVYCLGVSDSLAI